MSPVAISAHPAAAVLHTAPVKAQSKGSNALIYWHLLSLDAPCVAMLWAWFIARGNRVRLPIASVIAMGLAVWMLYAADRLLDARLALADVDLERRHFFHRKCQRHFRIGILVASLGLGCLLPGLAVASMQLYLILGSMLFAYFILIHVGSSLSGYKPRRMPKELAVGVFFSAATFIPTVSHEPALRSALLPSALLFAAVCSLNCLFIYAWEHPDVTWAAHPATRFALKLLPQLTGAVAIVGLAFAMFGGEMWCVPGACAVAGALLMLLHHNRRRLDPTTLRAAADICLLTPILFVPMMRL